MKDLTPGEQLYFTILNELHEKWTPHKAQIDACKDLINSKIDTLFLQCGRKYGKTELAAYLLWRRALLYPGSACYYICPDQTHGKEILWANNRLQSFGPEKYISSKDNTALRIKFANGSFIKVLGSENFETANGLTPDFLVYDEMKAFKSQFYHTMNPNRAVKNAPLVIIGTPPSVDSCNREQYLEVAEYCKTAKRSKWVCQNSYSNPHIDAKWLDEEKMRLFAKGEQDIWYREYEARIVAGGRSSVFPMFDRSLHVMSHESILKLFKRDFRRFEWTLVADPGTTTVFAGLWFAVHPYTKELLILDEVYESDRSKTSTGVIIPVFKDQFKNLWLDGDFEEDVYKVYDEAAAWFANEANYNYDVVFNPTQKEHNRKEDGLSLIKDILLLNQDSEKKAIYISDRCQNLIREMELYATDSNGKIPKRNDHLIDCFRYGLSAMNYDINEVRQVVTYSTKRGFTIQDDLKEKAQSDDWCNIFDKGFLK